MSKTILIATDYSLESLNILKRVLQEKNALQDNTQYNILFVSGYEMGDSIRDLLFTNKTQFSIKSDHRNFVMRMKSSAISTLIWLKNCMRCIYRKLSENIQQLCKSSKHSGSLLLSLYKKQRKRKIQHYPLHQKV